MEKIIGRDNELARLTEIAASDRPEFVAVYGRRRVGKTFLVRSAFNDKFVFYATGIIEGTYEQELEAFNIGLERYGWKGDRARSFVDGQRDVCGVRFGNELDAEESDSFEGWIAQEADS